VDDLKKTIIGDFKEIKKIGQDLHKEPVRIKENIKLKMAFDEMGRPRPNSAFPLRILSGCFRQESQLDNSVGNFDTR
tara:strand:+ start:216 stop:446 length:231 start_codon:yes stop_codon:yes gene_type:complete